MVKTINVPSKIFANPKYKGKHLLIVDEKVIASGNWSKVSKEFDKSVKKLKKAPTLAYVPKEESLILDFKVTLKSET